MSIFGNKQDAKEDFHVAAKGSSAAYGIGDVIRLLRTLPLDQHGDLVVRVIKNTLESLKVHVSDLVQDATKRQQELSQRIGTLNAKMLELTKAIDTHREEVSRLEADLAETTDAKERLQHADQVASGAAPQPTPAGPPSGYATPLPPPIPPPLRPGTHRPPRETVNRGEEE
jgi:hypothetical protein